MPLQLRRGTNAQRQSMTEPLAAGELIYITDTGAIYVGNGTTLGGVPVINLTATDIKPLAAEAFTSGSHTGISFTYNSGTQTVDAVVNPDLSNYAGVIRASAFEGSVFPDDSSLGGAPLVDGINASINLDGTVKGNIIPDQNETYDIGSNSNRFKDLYLSGSSLYLGNAVVTAVGSAVNLPAGSTVDGVTIGSGSGEGVVTGSNYNINIIGDDSSIIVNSGTGEITGNTIGYHTGDVKGSIFGDDSILLVDGVNSRIVGNINSIEAFFDSRGQALQSTITIVHDNEDAGIFLESIADTGGGGSKIILSSYRNSRESKSVLSADDVLGQVVFSGYTDSPIGTTDIAMVGFRGVHTIPGNISTIPESKLELLCFKGPDPANAKIATFDATGNFNAPIIQPGIYADATARDTAITSPLAGMMVFNTALQKFQGYVSDTGLAGGGSSNSTPGWIDLN